MMVKETLLEDVVASCRLGTNWMLPVIIYNRLKLQRHVFDYYCTMILTTTSFETHWIMQIEFNSLLNEPHLSSKYPRKVQLFDTRGVYNNPAYCAY